MTDIDETFKKGDGILIKENGRLAYTNPESVGWDGNVLKEKLEEIVQLGLDSMAFPGCQLLVAKEGKVIFEESYGYHTYEKKTPVKKTDLYDLASVTKVSGCFTRFDEIDRRRRRLIWTRLLQIIGLILLSRIRKSLNFAQF